MLERISKCYVVLDNLIGEGQVRARMSEGKLADLMDHIADLNGTNSKLESLSLLTDLKAPHYKYCLSASGGFLDKLSSDRSRKATVFNVPNSALMNSLG